MKKGVSDNKRLAFCSMMAALCGILGIAANYIRFNTAFFLLAMSLVMCIVTQRAGALYSAMTCIAAGALVMLVTGNYILAAEFVLLFGSYPVFKYVIETGIINVKVERVVKFLYYAVVAAVWITLTELFFGGAAFWGQWYAKHPMMKIVCFVAMIILEAVYDVVLTYLIFIFNKRFNGRMFR
ncbi:MAG: hypothetical protein J6L92_00915 [Clostridia bacterium]|nr:hypothetical protein [Clostridia bacterium]